MAEVRFQVPALRERPVLGTSCCATSAEVAIVQEFWLVGGVEDCAVDVDGALVWARYDPARVTAEALATALGEIGYPPSAEATPAP